MINNPNTMLLQKVDLPSKYMFYSFKEMHVKKLSILDYKNLMALIRLNNDEEIFKGFVEAVDRCCDVDVNTLTIWDFIYVLYYLREISFPKTPIVVNWMSHYGNMLTTKLNITNLNVYTPTITQEQLNEFNIKGYRVPTVKDINAEIFLDVLNTNTAKPSTILMENVEIFFAGQTTAQKIKTMEQYSSTMDLDTFTDEVMQFFSLIAHGITEELKLKDTMFDPHAWVEKLKSKISEYDESARLVKDPTELTMILAIKTGMESELKSIEDALERGDSVEPMTEIKFLPKGFKVLLPCPDFKAAPRH